MMRDLQIIQIDQSRGSIFQTTYSIMEKIIGQFKLMGVHKDTKLKDAKEKPAFIAKNVKFHVYKWINMFFRFS